MPIRLGSTELIIVLVIVVLFFGAGRIGRVAGELGAGLRNFRSALGSKEELGQDER